MRLGNIPHILLAQVPLVQPSVIPGYGKSGADCVRINIPSRKQWLANTYLDSTEQIYLDEVACRSAQPLNFHCPEPVGVVYPTSRDLQLSLRCSYLQHIADAPAWSGTWGSTSIFPSSAVTDPAAWRVFGFGVSVSGHIHQCLCMGCAQCGGNK